MPIPDIRTVANWLRAAERIVTLSGAGLSKASGIPTYRDAGGLWKQGNNLAFSRADHAGDILCATTSRTMGARDD